MIVKKHYNGNGRVVALFMKCRGDDVQVSTSTPTEMAIHVAGRTAFIDA